MKRLMSMFVAAAVTFAAAAPAVAQSKQLAGSWAFDAEKSKPKEGPPLVVITQSESELTVRLGSATSKVMTFKLDGTESKVGDTHKTKAGWKGNRLEATVTSPTYSETIAFSREGDYLVMEGKSDEHGPMKLYFKKVPSGL